MTALQVYDADPLIVVSVSDLHINSTVGLCPAHIHLDDGGYYTPSTFQTKLFECWTDFWSQVKQEKESHKARLVTVLNGDIVDGDHHRSPQIVSTNMETQRQAALDILEPVRDISDDMYVIRGTEAHNGLSCQAEEAIAHTLHACPTQDGAWSWWNLKAVFGGVGFDFAHHGQMGRLPWTKPNLLSRLAVEIELAYYRAGLPLPAYAVRGHNHRSGDTGLNFPVRVISLPGWQGPTAFVHRIQPGALPEIGGAIFTIEKGISSFRMVSYTKSVEWVN